MNKKTIMFAAFAATVPFVVFGNPTSSGTTGLDSGLTTLSGWISTLGQLIIAATVVAFFWGVFQFVFNPEKKEEGKDMMLWGIIGLFVMVSLWGIIGFLQKSTVGDDATIRDSIGKLVPNLQ